MINPLSINGKLVHNLYEYVCDTTNDVKDLPKSCAIGSTVFVIETAEVYMINSYREWVKIDINKKSSSSTTQPEGLPILSGTVNPAASLGQDGQLYLKYHAVAALPTGYSQLLYIEATGSQWIDTGVTPTINTSFDIPDATIMQSTRYGTILGEGNSNGRIWAFRLKENTGKFSFQIGADSACAEGPVAIIGQAYNCHGEAGKLVVDGVEYTASGMALSNPMTTLRLFSNGYGENGHTRIGSCQIYESGILIRDFYAAKRDSDNAIGMYDIVEGRFYTNSGSDTFGFGFGDAADGKITAQFVKVNGTWQKLIGANVNDITLSVGPVPETPILTRAEWNALTTEQKQSYGYVSIQDYTTGFSRGEFVYGADYVPTLLTASMPADIRAEARFDNWAYKPGETVYGGLTLLNPNLFTKNADGSVNMNGNTQEAYYDLGEPNTSVTNYMLSKSNTNSSMARLITNANGESVGHAPGFYRNGGMLFTTYFSSDVSTGLSALDYHVIAVAVDCSGSPKTARYYVDGVLKDQKNLNSSGQYSEFTATWIHGNQTYGDNTDVKYIAVVAGAESNATVIANMQSIMSHYGIGDE